MGTVKLGSISSNDLHGDNKNTVHVSERLPVISRSNSGIAMKEEYEENFSLGNGIPMSISLKGKLDFNRIARHTFIHLPFSPKTSLLTQGLWNPLESIRYLDIFHWQPKLNVYVEGCQCNINKIFRDFPLAPKTQCLCLFLGANVISIRYLDIFHWHPKLNVYVDIWVPMYVIISKRYLDIFHWHPKLNVYVYLWAAM